MWETITTAATLQALNSSPADTSTSTSSSFTTFHSADYNGENEGDNTENELQPTILPYACLPSYYANSYNINRQSSHNYGETGPTIPSYRIESISLPKVLANVQYLFENSIIRWPNFTVLSSVADYNSMMLATGENDNIDYCLPNCGICSTHTGDFSYFIFNLLIIVTLLPLVGMCGIIGNSLSAYVYSRPSMSKQSTNLYLCALGCSDNAVILTALFLFFVDSIKRHSAALSVIYARLSPVIYPAGMFAQTCSVYFTLVAGVDCFIKVCTNKELQRCFGSVRFARCAIIGTLIFSVLYNVPHGFEAILVDCWHVQFQSRSVEVCPAPFRFNPTYITVYYKYMYSIFLAVGPLLLLIVLNSCIILVTVCTKRRRRKPPVSPSKSTRQDRNLSTRRTYYAHNHIADLTRGYNTSVDYQNQQLQQPHENNMSTTAGYDSQASYDYRNSNYHMSPFISSAIGTTSPILKTSSLNNTVELSSPSSAIFDNPLKNPPALQRISFDEVNNTPTADDEAASSSDDNMALILVVLLFIACNSVALLINVFETRLSNLLEWRINYIIDVSNLLVVFNSSFNIVIYYNFSCAYRETFLSEVFNTWRKRYCGACEQRRQSQLSRSELADRTRSEKKETVTATTADTVLDDTLINENSRTELLNESNAYKTPSRKSSLGLAKEFLDSPILAIGSAKTKLGNGTLPITAAVKNRSNIQHACSSEKISKDKDQLRATASNNVKHNCFVGSRCSDCVCRLLLDSGSPPPYRRAFTSTSTVSPTLSSILSTNSTITTLCNGSTIHSVRTSMKFGEGSPTKRSPSVILRVTKDYSSAVQTRSTNIKTSPKRQNLNNTYTQPEYRLDLIQVPVIGAVSQEQSPHSIIHIQDYDDDDTELAESCAELRYNGVNSNDTCGNYTASVWQLKNDC